MEGEEEVFDQSSGFQQLFSLDLQSEEGKDEINAPHNSQNQENDSNITD